jgi:Resolvase, N terminal domain
MCLTACAGLGLADLSALFAEMYERARGDLPDEDPARAFADRGVRLETTFQGAGVLNGDLTPECAAVVGKVLDALSAPAGAERGWAVTATFKDDGFSGFKEITRDGFGELIAAIEAGAVDVVIVRDIDRLTRNLTDWNAFEKACVRHGVRLSAYTQGHFKIAKRYRRYAR